MRRIISIICAVFICIMGTVPAGAQPVAATNGWSNMGGLEINWSGDDTELDGFIAVYDQAGTLVQLAVNHDKDAVRLTPRLQSGEYNIKTFIWNNMQPQTDAKEMSVSAICCEEITECQTEGEQLTGICTREKVYLVASDAVLYINGVQVTYNEYVFKTYIKNNDSGPMLLQDTNGDGAYDELRLSYYLSAVLDAEVTAEYKNKLSYSSAMMGMEYISLDDAKVEAGELTYHLTLNGKEAAPSELREGDVVSVAYDVNYRMKESPFYDIIATRGTVTGQVTQLDEKGYIINYTYYRPPLNEFSQEGDTTLDVGTTYELWIDTFGRIIDFIESTIVIKPIVILDTVSVSAGEAQVGVILPNNQYATYPLKNQEDAAYIASIIGNGTVDKTEEELRADLSFWDNNSFTGEKAALQNRVAAYLLDEENRFEIDELQKPDRMAGLFDNKAIGRHKFHYSARLIDATGYTNDVSQLNAVSLSNLIEGCQYVAYGFAKGSDGLYRSAIITEAQTIERDPTTQFAIFDMSMFITDPITNQSVQAIQVYKNGELNTYELSPDLCGHGQSLSKVLGFNLTLGDVLALTMNNQNQVEKIDAIYDHNLSTGYDAFRKTFLDAAKAGETEQMFTLPQAWHEANPDIKLVFGPIVDRSYKSISIAKVLQDGTSIDGREIDCSIDANTIVYVFDALEIGRNRLYVGTSADIVKSSFTHGHDNIDWTGDEVIANFAFMKVVDGIAEEILVILSDQ